MHIGVISPTLGADRMLTDLGYRTTTVTRSHDPGGYDAVVFCGGSDIHPAIYKARAHPTSSWIEQRDAWEISLHKKYKSLKKIGICRGAQLLCALNGGTLWQDVNHHMGHHTTLDIPSNKLVIVSSVHHQMCRLTNKMELIAYSSQATRYCDDKETVYEKQQDPEAFFIPDDQALCVQFHPEFGPASCTAYFDDLMKRYFH